MTLIIDTGEYEKCRMKREVMEVVNEIKQEIDYINRDLEEGNYGECDILSIQFSISLKPQLSPVLTSIVNSVSITELLESINNSFENYRILRLCSSMDEYKDIIEEETKIDIAGKIMEVKQKFYNTFLTCAERLMKEDIKTNPFDFEIKFVYGKRKRE